MRERLQEVIADIDAIPATVDAEERAEARAFLEWLAADNFVLLGCRDYARVDIRLRDGLPQILEINANPDISPDAGLARSAAAAGMDYPQLVGRVLDMARGRKEAVDA